MDPRRVARLLRRLRAERGWTQGELAHRLGISRQALFLLESGRGLPSLPLAFRIARLCERPLESIFGQGTVEAKEVSMFRRGFDPFFELDRIHRELDRMFSEAFRPVMRFGREFAGMEFPPVNIRETPREVVIEAQLPGVSAKDLQLSVTEDRISLRGERKEETKVEDKDFIRREYSFGSFAREVVLPTKVVAEEAEATLKNGVLTVRVPKKEPTEKGAREIKVKEE